MIKVREGAFETNSSSVHSLVVCEDGEYQKLRRHEAMIACGNDIVSKEDVVKNLINAAANGERANMAKMVKEEFGEDLPQDLRDLSDEVFRYLAYYYIEAQYLDDYMDDERLETYSYTYVTSRGDTICIFGKYGRDD